MRRLLILAIALAVSGATASLAIAQIMSGGPFAEVHKPPPTPAKWPGERVASWLQEKLG